MKEIIHISVESNLNVPLGQTVTPKSAIVLTTDYVSNLVYESGQLKYILNPEGYAVRRSTGDYSYNYYLKDHLGNNRIVLEMNDSTPKVIQATDYYPFGMPYADSQYPERQPYKFGGKEYDEMHGLNWYDFHARHLGTAIPIFTTPDPPAEKYYWISPYVFCGNDPVNRIDPTGESWEPFDSNGNTVKIDDYDNIHGYRWVDYDTDADGHKVARANTVETAYTFGANGMTTLTSEGYQPQTTWQAYSDISTGDARTDAKLASLHPDVQNQMKSFILKAEYRYGIDLRVTDGYRTYAEQDAIYAKGRTAAGSIVTNAKGGQSNHNFGLAIDVVPYENGKINYNTTQWETIGKIGESRGLEWGGRWKFVDRPHFQNLFGKTLKELRALKKDASGLPIF